MPWRIELMMNYLHKRLISTLFAITFRKFDCFSRTTISQKLKHKFHFFRIHTALKFLLKIISHEVIKEIRSGGLGGVCSQGLYASRGVRSKSSHNNREKVPSVAKGLKHFYWSK